MQRFWPRLLVLALLMLAASLLLVVVGRSYLASPHVVAQVAASLEAQYGGPVQVGGAQIGVTSSSFQQVKLYEAGAGPADEPWATIKEFRADVSLAGVVRGAAHPRHLEVTGAELILRFDEHGRLLTRLPARKKGEGVILPDIRLHQSRVTLRQEGRPAFVVQGIDAEVRSEDGRLILHGTVRDPRWSTWGVNASIDSASGESTSNLKSADRIHVTQDMLNDLPFVGANVWQNVQAEGDTPVNCTLHYDPEKKALHYRIALEPENTHVHVTSINLTADNTRGKVLIEDAVVRVTDVQGQAADGRLFTDAFLDFHRTPYRLAFSVRAEKLDLVQLPNEWKIPRHLSGRLSGHADLVVTIQDGKARTNGEGQGEITEARVFGMSARPIRLRLHSEGDGFRFSAPSAPASEPQSGAMGWDWAAPLALLLAASPTPGPAFTPGEAADRVGSGVLEAADGFLTAGTRLLRAVPKQTRLLPGADKPAGQPPSYLEANLTLDDVDLEKLARQLKLDLPLPISGRASVHVRVAFPLDDAQDLKAYRLVGTASSSRLSIAGVEMRQLRARVKYADGVMRLEELRGQVSAARQTEEGAAGIGSFQGSARLDVAPPGDAVANVILERVPLDRILALLPASTAHARGPVSGTVAARAPAARLQDIAAWKASGHLESGHLEVNGLALDDAKIDLKVDKGLLDYHIEGGLAGGKMKLEGQVPARGPERSPNSRQPPEAALQRDVIPVRQAVDQPGGGRLEIRGLQLSRLWEGLVIQGGQAPLRGTVDLDLRFRQETITEPPTGSGQLVIRRLRWDRTEVAGEVQATVTLTPRALQITDLSAVVGEGVLRGRAAWPLHVGERGWFNIALDNVESSRLVAAWPQLAGRIEGPAEISMRASLDHEWSGSGRVTLLRGRVLGVEVVDWELPIDFVVAPQRHYGQISIRDHSAQVAQGRVTGRAAATFDAVTRLEGIIRFTGLDLPSLLRQSSDQSQMGPGKITGRIDFASNAFRSLDDVSATIDASLQQTQTLNYPVLQQLAPFLRMGQSSSTFRNGDLRARLDRGIIRIQRLTLSGNTLQLFIEGSVTLEGRLALEVTANTGQVGANPRLLRLLGLRIPAVGPIPVALLLEASTYLSNRVIHLRVTGTIRNPVVQVEPVSLLSDEVVRYFLNRTSLPIP
jgi:hypothetical protein